MAGVRRERKKKRRKRGRPCECGWRVDWTARFRRQAQAMVLWPGLRRELRDIEKRLNNPEARASTQGILPLRGGLQPQALPRVQECTSAARRLGPYSW